MPDDTFASRLRAARLRAGLTQEQVGAASGLGRLGVLSIEGGRREPLISTARRLAEAVGASLEELVPPTPPAE